MWEQFGCKCKLLHHIAANQIVGATFINDQTTQMLLNDTLYSKQCMWLIMLCLLHLWTKHVLHNKALITLCIICINLFF
jgi:predicted RND superfamily exporter protein